MAKVKANVAERLFRRQLYRRTWRDASFSYRRIQIGCTALIDVLPGLFFPHFCCMYCTVLTVSISLSRPLTSLLSTVLTYHSIQGLGIAMFREG